MPERLSRREFAALVGTVALPGMPAAQKEKDPLDVQAEALLALAKARYGEHLNEEQLTDLGRGIRRTLGSAQGLYRVKLANADEPAVVFSADLP
jgi:hypothetical protein